MGINQSSVYPIGTYLGSKDQTPASIRFASSSQTLSTSIPAPEMHILDSARESEQSCSDCLHFESLIDTRQAAIAVIISRCHCVTTHASG